MPAFWRDQPKIERHHAWWMQCFGDLSSSRTFGGMGSPNPISYAEIETYARLHRVPPAHLLDFAAVIRSMDQTFMASIADKMKEPGSGRRNSPGAGP